MLAIASAAFGYYTVWVFVLPFVSSTSILQSLFLPRDYAIKLPFLLLLLGLLAVGLFIGSVLIKNAEKAKKKKSKSA